MTKLFGAARLTAAGVPTTGYNSWLFDQVGISDDGYLFAGNLAGVGGSGTTNGRSGVRNARASGLSSFVCNA